MHFFIVVMQTLQCEKSINLAKDHLIFHSIFAKSINFLLSLGKLIVGWKTRGGKCVRMRGVTSGLRENGSLPAGHFQSVTSGLCKNGHFRLVNSGLRDNDLSQLLKTWKYFSWNWNLIDSLHLATSQINPSSKPQMCLQISGCQHAVRLTRCSTVNLTG